MFRVQTSFDRRGEFKGDCSLGDGVLQMCDGGVVGDAWPGGCEETVPAGLESFGIECIFWMRM